MDTTYLSRDVPFHDALVYSLTLMYMPPEVRALKYDSVTSALEVLIVITGCGNNHRFGCLPRHRTPSIQPNSTLFSSRLSGMQQICPVSAFYVGWC